MDITLRFTNYKLFCTKIIVLTINRIFEIPNDLINNIIMFFSLCDQSKNTYCIVPHKWNTSFFNSIHINIDQRIFFLLDYLIGPTYNNGIIDTKWSLNEKKLIYIAKKNIKYFRGYTINNLSFDNLFDEIIKRIPVYINIPLHASIFIYWGEITNILMNFGINVRDFYFKPIKNKYN